MATFAGGLLITNSSFTFAPRQYKCRSAPPSILVFMNSSASRLRSIARSVANVTDGLVTAVQKRNAPNSDRIQPAFSPRAIDNLQQCGIGRRNSLLRLVLSALLRQNALLILGFRFRWLGSRFRRGSRLRLLCRLALRCIYRINNESDEDKQHQHCEHWSV